MIMKELKVGERVSVTFEAVELSREIDCDSCYFNRKGDCCARYFDFECRGPLRSDGKNIVFKEVKE